MNSFGLLRTNVGLTTNMKIVVDSKYGLSMDSIESHPKLAADKYKKVKFIKENYFDELFPFFYSDLPSEIAFSVKYDSDVDIMSSDFANQYDELYNYGARNITNNKNYDEEFEYFAPLYISGNNLPKKFIIFRVDGGGFEDSVFLTRENFKSEIIEKLKTVKLFDLTKETALGEWLDRNFKNNRFFPLAPLEFDFRPIEFCRWNGIDYESGGYCSKSLFVDEYYSEEKEIFAFERWTYDKYQELSVVFPNIINFSFLFDDTPSTPEIERKWSINRYYGFYLEDMIQTQTVSPYIPPVLRADTEIQSGNIIFSPSGGETGDPFVNGFNDSKAYWIEWKGNYYRVEKFTQETQPTLSPVTRNRITSQEVVTGTLTRFRIISDTDLQGKQSELNTNFGYIDNQNFLRNFDNNFLEVSNFSTADVWLIEINGIFHNLTSELIGTQSAILVNSDYAFTYSPNNISYRVAGKTTTVSTSVDFENPPKKWTIYKLKFTDIKDFDTRIIDTEYSKYEYEKLNDLTKTDETKMYVQNLGANSTPKPLDDFIWKENVENIPVSSEYTANNETFKIENGQLSNIWRKNPIYTRWCFQGSRSANDYPYLLNNSLIFEDYNRTTNTSVQDPTRIERNLDYFYTINSSTSSYIHHSLHIEKLNESKNIDSTFSFELDKYLNLATYSIGTSSATWSGDYFSNFFDRKAEFDSGRIIKNVEKFSTFTPGDKYTPNMTLFRGIKFYLQNVDSIERKENGDINSINLSNSNSFENWKFSILLSDNDKSVNDSGTLVLSENQMQWQIISEWEMDKDYTSSEIVVFDDILYISNVVNKTEQPTQFNNITQRTVKSSPHNQTSWNLYNSTYSVLWNPTKTYVFPSQNAYDWLVYNNKNYYQYNSAGVVDFWNPITANNPGYGLGDVVLYEGQFYSSMTSSNSFTPDTQISTEFNSLGTDFIKFWQPTTTTQSLWSEIPLWNPSTSYQNGTIIVHNLVVYTSQSFVPPGEEPGISNLWNRRYSIEPDTNYPYTPDNNPIISMNNRYYLVQSNSNLSTLDNGIIIYINKKWKNVLVNINIADNTIPNISEMDRDSLYNDLNKKITAYNLINSINDITGKYGFTDYVSYIIIEESGQIRKYNYQNNLTQLPVMLICEGAEEINMKADSLIKKANGKPSELKSSKQLKNGRISNINELNYFNGEWISTEILENKDEPKVFDRFHGGVNIISNTIYRFSGQYMPLFYNIQLFKKDSDNSETGNFIFDTSLTEFGMIKGRIISKVNRKGSILKLKDLVDISSQYPMLDELGYSVMDFFIFTSTWQFGYHFESNLNPESVDNSLDNEISNPITSPGISPISTTEILSDILTIGRPFRNDNNQQNISF
jgi:hypothetical protein